MNTTKSNDNHPQYHCCFCHHFQLEGYRWGHCKLLNVYIKGNINACSLATPPFSAKEQKD